MAESILRKKSYQYSIKIVKLCESLVQEKKEWIMSKQLLRSGTAIGAIMREAEFGQSRADFVSKMNIALKEANETMYRLDILKDTGYINETQHNEVYTIAHEILKMLIATVKTTKQSMKPS